MNVWEIPPVSDVLTPMRCRDFGSGWIGGWFLGGGDLDLGRDVALTFCDGRCLGGRMLGG